MFLLFHTVQCLWERQKPKDLIFQGVCFISYVFFYAKWKQDAWVITGYFYMIFQGLTV